MRRNGWFINGHRWRYQSTMRNEWMDVWMVLSGTRVMLAIDKGGGCSRPGRRLQSTRRRNGMGWME
eukprot:354096-Chlamydomonas_euryale.AAC.6